MIDEVEVNDAPIRRVTPFDHNELTGPVVVLESPGAVYFGTRIEHIEGSVYLLHNAQHCCSTSPSLKGWTNLASSQPSDANAIAPPVKWLLLRNVTEICACSELAAQQWKACPWPKVQMQMAPQQPPGFARG